MNNKYINTLHISAYVTIAITYGYLIFAALTHVQMLDAQVYLLTAAPIPMLVVAIITDRIYRK